MPIDALPTPPLRTDPANFATRGDAFLAALPAFVTQANETAAAMNLNSTTDTSASSVIVGLGSKTFTVTAGKSFQPGMWLVIASTAAPSTNALNGTITSYSGTTLVMNIVTLMGSGTIAAWTISQSAPGGTATLISNTPAGFIVATTMQAAINELDAEKARAGPLAASGITGAAASGANSDLTSLAGLTTALSVAQGGTGFTNATAARQGLGVPLNATVALTAAYTVVAADNGKLFDCAGTLTISLSAAATLGAGFSFAVRNNGTGVVTLDPNLAELIDGVATVTYVAGVSSLVTCNGAEFKTVGRASVQVLHLQDQRVTATTGGAAVAGDQARILNTVVKNTITGASATLGADFTLPAGTYRAQCSAHSYGADRNRIRLFNATDAVNTLLGQAGYGSSSGASNAPLAGEFTITGQKTFRVIHFTTLASSPYGLGVNVSDTFAEVFADVLITKVG